MNQIIVTFGKAGLPDYDLTWNVLDHRPAEIWFKLFQHELMKNREYFFRFSGFMNNEKTEEDLIRKLQAHIDVINKDGRYQIAEKALIFDQEFSNKIHHHFEILHGGFDMPAKFYLDSPMPVRIAILGLNHCVHDLETLAKNVKYAGTEYELYVFSGIMLEIHNCYRTFIPGSFYKYFTLNLDFGDMVIHYSQIGKTWLEAFYDDDKDVFDSGIRPHYALSGEFDILFGKLTPDQKHLENLKAFLEARGKDINDPNLRLGHLPVAKLATGEKNFKQVKEEVGKRSRIKRVVAMNDGKVSAKRVFILLDDTLPV